MGTRFTGWPEQAFDVLLQLDGDPTHETRERYRESRELLVRQPMIALLNDVADANPVYADFSVWGFAKDLWWWQHQGAVVRIADNLEIALRFDLDGLYVKGSWHHPGTRPVTLFREAVANVRSGPELAAIISTLEGRGYVIIGDHMSRMPRGFSVEHDRSTLLRYRSLAAARAVGSDDRMATPDAVDQVLTAFGELEPLLSWFTRHVAEPEID